MKAIKYAGWIMGLVTMFLHITGKMHDGEGAYYMCIAIFIFILGKDLEG